MGSGDDRDVGAMARALQMDRNVLQYHLDCLIDANFADEISLNYLTGKKLFGPTPEGRRYVVEGKLI